MRKFLLFLSILMVLGGCKSKKTSAPSSPAPVVSRTTKVNIDKVDELQKDRAYNLGFRVLNACNTSKFKPFTKEEATESVIRNSTQERLTKTCHNFRLKYGNFKDIKLMEIHRDRQNKIHIFRYKAEYSKKIANKELRVMVNENNQVNAIKSLDWVDEFK